MSQHVHDWGGPYVQAAFFCERLLQEADGVLSAIRIVDHVTVQVDERQTVPTSVPVDLTFLVLFKTGRARGPRVLLVEMEPPDGHSPVGMPQEYMQTIVFEGPEDRGDIIIMPIAMKAAEAGTYWFDVYLDARFMTRVPLRVEIQGQTPASHLR